MTRSGAAASGGDKLQPATQGGAARNGRTALILGASGLVGSACLAALLEDPAYGHVTAVVRRPLPISHPRLTLIEADVVQPAGFAPIRCDDVFCAIGTTLARAGSQDAFRRVDEVAVVAMAALARRGGATRAALVSSVGADAPGRNFYLQVKADAERGVAALGFDSLYILRPSLLLGSRADSRPAEAFGRALAPFLNGMLVGPLRRYRAIGADVVGRAMVGALHAPAPGRHVLEYDGICRAAQP